METRRTIIAVVLAVLLIVFWGPLINMVGTWLGYDMSQVNRPTTQPTEVRNEPILSGEPTTLPSSPTTGPSSSTTSPTVTGGATTRGTLRVVGGQAKQIELGSARPSDPDFALLLQLDALGASVASVTLNDYRAEVGSNERYRMAEPYPGVGVSGSFQTRQLTVNGKPAMLGEVPWTLETSSATHATFAVDLFDDQARLATVRKTFRIVSRGEGGEEGPRGLSVVINQSIQNHSDAPLQVQTLLNGPTLPPAELDYGADRQVVAGFFDGSRIAAEGHAIESMSDSSRSVELLTNGDGEPVLWFGTGSTYFAAIVWPQLAEGQNVPTLFEKITATLLNPGEKRSWHRQVETQLLTKPREIGPGGTLDLPLNVFFGPRKREILANGFYGAPSLRLDKVLVISSGPCSICVFPSLIDGLVFLLRGFHFILRDWGLAIIALVGVVRLLLHPITRKSQLSMMKMSKLGPEIERLKKKYGDNKEELSRAMMQFYRETGFSPLMGCLPMLLQMPIWIALWNALHTTFELRHASFLWGLTWIDNLAAPDHLIYFGRENAVSIFILYISGLNVLPLLLAVIFYLQMKLQPKPVTMTPEQAQQQKIMMWMMPILFPLMLYSQPSGLNLYILVSTAIGIIESKAIRKHAERIEALQSAGAVIVDAPLAKDTRRPRGSEPSKKGGLAGWLANLQEKAEQMRREAEKQKPRRRK